MHRFAMLATLTILCSLLALSLAAEEVERLALRINVLDESGQWATGLESDDFSLSIRGQNHELKEVENQGGPLSLMVVLDYSASLNSSLERPDYPALIQSDMPALSGESEYGLIAFSNKAVLARPLAPRGGQQVADLDQLLTTPPVVDAQAGRRRLRSALFEALKLALAQLEQARHSNQAIVVVSDGRNSTGEPSLTGMLHTLRQANVRLCFISKKMIFTGKNRAAKYLVFPSEKVIHILTNTTGGLSKVLDEWDEMASAVDAMTRGLQDDSYTLYFEPADPEPTGKFYRLRVDVFDEDNPDSRYQVIARSGYIR